MFSSWLNEECGWCGRGVLDGIVVKLVPPGGALSSILGLPSETKCQNVGDVCIFSCVCDCGCLSAPLSWPSKPSLRLSEGQERPCSPLVPSLQKTT